MKVVKRIARKPLLHRQYNTYYHSPRPHPHSPHPHPRPSSHSTSSHQPSGSSQAATQHPLSSPASTDLPSATSSSSSSSGAGGAGGGSNNSSSNPHTTSNNPSSGSTNSSPSLCYTSHPSSPSPAPSQLPSVSPSTSAPSNHSSALSASSSALSANSAPLTTCPQDENDEETRNLDRHEDEEKRGRRSWQARRKKLKVMLNVAAYGIPKRSSFSQHHSGRPLHLHQRNTIFPYPRPNQHHSSLSTSAATSTSSEHFDRSLPPYPSAPSSSKPYSLLKNPPSLPRSKREHNPDSGLDLAVQVGEDAYFISDMAMGVADGVGGWKKQQERRRQPQSLSPSSATRPQSTSRYTVPIDEALEEPSPSALFARRLMHFCAKEVEMDRQSQPGPTVHATSCLSTHPETHISTSSATSSLPSTIHVSQVNEILIPDGYDEYNIGSTNASLVADDGIFADLASSLEHSFDADDYENAYEDYLYDESDHDYACIDEALDDLSDGIDVLSILERAYEKTLSVHTQRVGIGDASLAEFDGIANKESGIEDGEKEMVTDGMTSSSDPQTVTVPLMSGSSTALVAVLDCVRVSSPRSASASPASDLSSDPLTSTAVAGTAGEDTDAASIIEPGQSGGALGISFASVDGTADFADSITSGMAAAELGDVHPHIAIDDVVISSTSSAAPNLAASTSPHLNPPTSSPQNTSTESATRTQPQDLGSFTPVIKIAHVGDCAAILVRGDEIVWRSEEMWWDFNTPVQLGPTSPITPGVLKSAGHPNTGSTPSSASAPSHVPPTSSCPVASNTATASSSSDSVNAPILPSTAPKRRPSSASVSLASSSTNGEGISSKILGSIPSTTWSTSSDPASSKSAPLVYTLPPLLPAASKSFSSTASTKQSAYSPLSTLHTPAAHLITLPVQEDDILILASDGLTDNLWDGEVLDEVIKFRKSWDSSEVKVKKQSNAAVGKTASDGNGVGCDAQDSGYESDEHSSLHSQQPSQATLDQATSAQQKKKEATQQLAAQLSEALCSRARRVAERKHRHHGFTSGQKHTHSGAAISPTTITDVPTLGSAKTSLFFGSGLRGIPSSAASPATRHMGMGAVYPYAYSGITRSSSTSHRHLPTARFASTSALSNTLVDEKISDSLDYSDREEIPFARRAREYGKKWRGGRKSDDISVIVAIISPN